MMETHFASVDRADEKTLRFDVEHVAENPLIDALLKSTLGLIAVLNEHRQILMVNDSFLRVLGITDGPEALGLRPGEALKCSHAFEMPGGCGTSRYCVTCGAAIAIVAALADEGGEERKCVLTVEDGKFLRDICLRVRASVFVFGERKYVLLFMQDVTASERHAVLERVFFHDVSNLVTGLVGTSQQLLDDEKGKPDELASDMHTLSVRLAKEITMQSALLRDELAKKEFIEDSTGPEEVFEELRKVFEHHPAAHGKTLTFSRPAPPVVFKHDLSMMLRVLTNMVQNALEATGDGGEVKVWVDAEPGRGCFRVWNKGAIPSAVALRIFQRHFSTKSETGRGFGTFAMKLFGEQFLGGKVDFTSSPKEGTIFRFCLPA